MRQQLLKAWQPIPTLGCGILIFFFFGRPASESRSGVRGSGRVHQDPERTDLGVATAVRRQVRESSHLRAHLRCHFGGRVDDTRILRDQVARAHRSGFYQSHRKFFGSKSYDQLLGKDLREADLSSCKPAIKNSDMFSKKNHDGTKDLDQAKVAYPCGVMARSIFNGNLFLVRFFQTR